MTVEEAIYILSPETTDDALSGMMKDEAIKKVEEACWVAVHCMFQYVKNDRSDENE